VTFAASPACNGAVCSIKVTELPEKTRVSRLPGGTRPAPRLNVASALVNGRFRIGLQCLPAEGKGTMSPRSIAALMVLLLQLLQLGACAVSKSSNAAIEEMERRHEEDMKRMGGGSGGSM
jgi:hypothetical protein